VTSFQRERQALGLRLRELRQDARLTGKQLAQSQRWQPSKVSRIETGQQTPSDEDVETWARACGAPEATADLIAALRTLEGHYLEDRRAFRAGKARLQWTIAERESKRSTIRNFQSVIVPGLVQTSEYARQRLQSGARYGGPPNDLNDAVAARMARQQVLYRPDVKVHIVMAEGSLRYLTCPPEVMEGQLDRLREVAAMRAVRLGIIPFHAQYDTPPLHGFSVYDENEVAVETLTAMLTLTEPSEISAYLALFGQYATAAVYGTEARAIITRVLAELATSSG